MDNNFVTREEMDAAIKQAFSEAVSLTQSAHATALEALNAATKGDSK